MIEKTILDAAERVERARQAGLQLGPAVEAGHVVPGAVAGALPRRRRGLVRDRRFRENGNTDPIRFVTQFNNVAETWVEPNVLLMNSYWPRNAFIEVVRFNDTTEHRNEMHGWPRGAAPRRAGPRHRVGDRRSQFERRLASTTPSDLPKFVDSSLLARVNIPRIPTSGVNGSSTWTICIPRCRPASCRPAWQSKKASYIKSELHKDNDRYWKNLVGTASVSMRSI